MSETDARICSPGPGSRSIRTPAGQVLDMPADWELLPPGDATLTRRVKQAASTWTVQEKRGRKIFSQGVWAPAAVIAKVRAEIEAERSTPAYAAARRAQARRRERVQHEYEGDFAEAVLAFLDFAPRYADLAAELARRVAAHATPIGSGTVARTERIPLAQRAESAVIAWLRHQTTAYDHLSVPRVKGARRELRRQLAQRSRQLLELYRRGQDTSPDCPLRQALARPASSPPPPTAPKPSAYDDFFLDE
ncbi:MAG: DUF2293 domain-containing protein [Lentisphaeria bacterium]|jgi:hypothetical protein|nr:DUF2293 domain-containing protein [Lentisphaeria bacterium]